MSDLSILSRALLSAASYEKPFTVTGVGPIKGWDKISQSDLAEDFFGDSNATQLPFQNAWGNGFFANAYTKTGGNEIVISFRGTDSFEDFLTQNVSLGIPGVGEQLLFAYFFVEAVKAFAASTGKTISFTGHSLGGSLASIFAIRENAEAVVFSPALSRSELIDMLDGFEEIIANADINFNPADLPAGLATFEEATPGIPSGVNTRVTIPPLDLGGAANSEAFIASREGNIDIFRIGGEVLGSVGLGPDVGTGQQTDIDIGDFELPFAYQDAIARVLSPAFGSLLGSVAVEAVALHSIELHALLIATGNPEAGEFPLADLASELPEFLPALHNADVVGNTDHSAGATFVREILRLHLENEGILTALKTDLEKLTNEGVAGKIEDIRKSLVQSVVQHAQAKITNEETGEVNGDGSFNDGQNAVLFDFSELTRLGVERSDIAGLSVITELRDSLVDDLDVQIEGREIPIVDIDAFGVQSDGINDATIIGLANKANFLIGGKGDDTLTGGSETDYLFGGLDASSFFGLFGEDLDDGQDTLRGLGGDDVLVGGKKADKLDGGAGKDFLFGGDGIDEIDGGDDEDEDILTGGADGDTFIAHTNDIITDIEKTDRIVFDGNRFRGAKEDPEHKNNPDIPRYKGDFGEVYELDGDDLIIRLPGDGGTVTVKNFKDKDAGITLEPSDDDGNGNGEGGVNDPSNLASPLVFDLDGDGFELSSVNVSSAFFDIDRDGFAERTGWVDADDGFLALDHNGDGRINDISELFGAGIVSPTASINAGLIPDRSGFTQLAELDDNGDRIFDAQDAAFQDVVIWRQAA